MIHRKLGQATEVRENMRGGAGTVTLRHLFAKEDFAANVRLCAQLTIPPGAGIGTHQHTGEDEVYFVMRGSGILDDGKSQTRVETGDAVLTGRGESHAIRNDSSEPLELMAMIVCYAGS